VAWQASKIWRGGATRKMGKFLTSQELVEFTGAKTRKAQARYLHNNGYNYEINRLGHIRILWTQLEARLGGQVTFNNLERTTEPDYGFFSGNRAR
jgi:hypothetical protein